jgi:predicted DNA-binding transcriptional regulator AlpA
MNNIRTLTPEELAPILGRAASTIRTDVRRRPQTLPPRLRIPGSNRLLWLETDVAEWFEKLRKNESPRRN